MILTPQDFIRFGSQGGAARDPNSTDAAITFVCTKGNNLERVPEPFGLQYTPGDGGAIVVANLSLSDASPETIEGATTPNEDPDRPGPREGEEAPGVGSRDHRG
jgi:hypothetical protein